MFENCILSFGGLKTVFVKLFEQIGWKWLYETGWFYMPFGVVFILTYGYSITWRKKRNNKNTETNDKQQENNK